MGNILRFFSLTTATQIFLAINQIFLLPLELRVWGSEVTTDWLVVVALGNLAGIADLGLRNAGHSQLVMSVERKDISATQEFRQTWAMTRLLFALMIPVIIFLAIFSSYSNPNNTIEFTTIALVVISSGLDTLLIVRGIWFDTLGYFNLVEGVYLSLTITRISISVLYLYYLNISPNGLAWIMVITSILGVALQTIILSKPKSLSLWASGFSELRLRSLSIILLVVAEPASSWVRISLPIVILGAISSPTVTATYAALRAIFGIARQVISQISRYASVKYAAQVHNEIQFGTSMIANAIILSTILAIGITNIVIADHGRLISLWLKIQLPILENTIVASFAIGAAGYGYQVILGTMIRLGLNSKVATRQYTYLIFSAFTAIIGYTLKSTTIYLFILAAQEFIFSITFTQMLNKKINIILIKSITIAVTIQAALSVLVEYNITGIFNSKSLVDIILSLGVASGVNIIIALIFFIIVNKIQL